MTQITKRASVMLVVMIFASGAEAEVVDGVDVGTDVATSVVVESLASPPALLAPPGAIVIDFDGSPAPCSFSLTTALRDAFIDLGVSFDGPSGNDGGAILDECGSFGVSGHSPPNFLAFNGTARMSDGGFARSPETLVFDPLVSLIEILAGSSSSAGQILTMEAFAPNGNLVDVDSLTLARQLQPLSVAGAAIREVRISGPRVFVLDNLAFVPAAVDINLEPDFAFNPLGGQHTLTATLTKGPNPVPDVEVTFEVLAGPNAGDGGVDTTDVNGEATFAYTGDGGTGVDEIEAWAVDDVGDTVESNLALKFWDKDCQDPPNDIPDTCDIDCDGFDGFCSEFAGCGGSADDDGNGVPDECSIPPVVSYGVEGSLPHSATLNGTPVRPADAVGATTGELFFSAFPDVILEDIDAFHLLAGGSVVFSTSTDVTQGFGGIPNIKNGDLVFWDGVEARLLFSELVGFGGADNNIDAFSILPNGNWLLSTDLNGTLGGLAFENGDVVEYDPDEDVASLYMGLDEATIFTGTPQSNADIDALHVTGDGVIFSIRSNGIGRIGVDLIYDWPDVASTDLFLLDPVSGHAELFLDGFRLFDGMTRNLDAVSLAPQARGTISIPEPGRSLLLGFGIVGLLVIGGRRIRA